VATKRKVGLVVVCV